MPTPFRHLFGAAALLASLVLSAVPTVAEPASLALEAQVDGTWVRVLGRDHEQLLGQTTTGSCKIPNTAPLRLTGDLAAHSDALDATATFDLVEMAQATDSPRPTQWTATRIHFYGVPPAGSAPHWRLTAPEKSILVCAWQKEGHVSHLYTMPIATGKHGQTAFPEFSFELADDSAGNPVFFLWEDGAIVPLAEPQTSYDHVAVLAALGRDEEAAAGLDREHRIPVPAAGVPPLLHLAVQAGARRTVALLLQLGAAPQSKDPAGNTVLHRAARVGRASTAIPLLASKAAVGAVDNNKATPLHLAAMLGHADLCALLIDAGAPVDTADKAGRTPFTYAFAASCTPAVEQLLAHGAKFRPGFYSAERELVRLAAKGQCRLVGLLLAHHTKPDKFLGNQTALIAASRGGHDDVVAALLAAKADLDQADPDGITPLLAACSRGREAVVRRLLAAGAQPSTVGPGGNTPLLAASFAGSGPSIRTLLAAGADIHATNGCGASALTFAVGSGSLDAIAALLAVGAKVDPASPFFDTELRSAITIDADAFVAAALQAGMPVSFRSANGWTPLQLADLAQARRCATLLRHAGATEPEDRITVATTPQQLDRPPEIIALPQFSDPRDPNELDIKGETVVVEAVVDQDGTAVIARADCADCRLAQSAVAMVHNAKFIPALSAGQPVASIIRLPIVFPDRSARTFDTASLWETPVLLDSTEPFYPLRPYREQKPGGATVKFTVAADGSVHDIVVVQSSDPERAYAVVQAVKKWRFKPAIFDGQPVACHVQQTVRWASKP